MHIRSTWRGLLAAGVLALQGFAVSSAMAAVPPGGRLDFTVLRDGEEIGRHELTFNNGVDALRVDIRTDIAVKVLFVTAYRFEHEGHEIWHDGQLVKLWSKTNDDGTAHDLNVAADGAKLAVEGDGKASAMAPGTVPASLWNEGILSGGEILNTLDGRAMAISVEDLGQDTVDVRGKSLAAHHYRVGGDLERELWYDAANVLVKVRFKGKDGSDIQYVLR